jgi:pimeloyl-ACP methyl ester carboxylesterase
MFHFGWNALLMILMLVSVIDLDHRAFSPTTTTTTTTTTASSNRFFVSTQIVGSSTKRKRNESGFPRKIGMPIMDHHCLSATQVPSFEKESAHSGPSAALFMAISNPSASSSSSSSSELSTQRVHNVNFVSPLLEYGYPPAATALELQQRRQRNGNETDVADDETYEKPILLYLPGFDGTYICPFIQFPELGVEFDVWCMTVGMDDRSTYPELRAAVLDFLKNGLMIAGQEDHNQFSEVVSSSENGATGNITKVENDYSGSPTPGGGFFAGWFGGRDSAKTDTKKGTKGTGRPVYLAGESFGGILALDVALTLLRENRPPPVAISTGGIAKVNLQGLVLINPATCYDRSQLAAKGPQVASMPNALYLFGLFTQLVPLFTDKYSVDQLLLILRAKALPSVIDTAVREAYMGRVAISLPTRLQFMPPSTLSWRLGEWLQTGSAALRGASFKEYPKFRSLIVVGENDKALPSIAEAERLATKVMLPSQVQIHVVKDAGHASTCGSRLDLAAVMRKRFPEFQSGKNEKAKMRQPKKTKDDGTGSSSSDGNTSSTTSSVGAIHFKRTSMKPQAQEGIGPYFGMEDRYDGADIGLNPILYWSKDKYRKVQKTTEERRILLPDTVVSTSYTKANYRISNPN